MIVLFYGEGRLGNQVLQYLALNHLAGTRGRILAVGLEDLGASLDILGAPVTVITRQPWLKRAIKYLLVPLLLRPVARYLRLLTYATEASDAPDAHGHAGGELIVRPGLVPGIAFVDGGYYQCASYLTAPLPVTTLRVPATFQAGACASLSEAASNSSPATQAFVHVRRGDFLTFSAFGQNDMALPEEYYRRAIAELAGRVGPLQLIFVTDDPGWVRRRFADLPGIFIVSSSAAGDLALMAECRAGILSNSTFALAAALLGRTRLLIAPRYWLGFRAATWLPPGVRIDDPRFLYIDVPSAGAPQ
jgi:hypothetical protein